MHSHGAAQSPKTEKSEIALFACSFCLFIPAGIPAITQPTPSLLQPLTANSFLLYSTRWNCTPSVAVVDGMLTLSSVKILPTYFLFYLRRLLLSNVMIMKEMLYEVRCLKSNIYEIK